MRLSGIVKLVCGERVEKAADYLPENKPYNAANRVTATGPRERSQRMRTRRPEMTIEGVRTFSLRDGSGATSSEIDSDRHGNYSRANLVSEEPREDTSGYTHCVDDWEQVLCEVRGYTFEQRILFNVEIGYEQCVESPVDEETK